MPINAILWDYDGTLADSTQKTIEVTLDILTNFIPDVRENIPKELSSKEAFQEAYGRIPDWKELYRTCYGLNDEQLVQGSSMWGEYQLKNKTESEFFDGIDKILEHFKGTKMGICTQNSSGIVKQTLENKNFMQYFGAVLGIEEVLFDEQKPHPAAFINCLKKLGFSDMNGTFVYIGDHSVDVAFGRNAEAALKKDFPDAKVICVAVHHPGNYCEEDKNFPPDYIAKNSAELFEILNGI